jgi:hypothetical protein
MIHGHKLVTDGPSISPATPLADVPVMIAHAPSMASRMEQRRRQPGGLIRVVETPLRNGTRWLTEPNTVNLISASAWTAAVCSVFTFAATGMFAAEPAASPTSSPVPTSTANDSSVPVLRVVYFTPRDRRPEPDRVERLDRVLSHVQEFLRRGMEANGFGPRTFPIDRDAQGRLRLIEVQGEQVMQAYGRNDASRVREEVNRAVAAQGIDLAHDVVIIFQQLLAWDGPRAIELGPYVGGGDGFQGTAWVYDDAKLDPRLLTSQEPGGFYAGPCSLGKFNTHYLGGVAHELGHALGLPHDRELPSESARRGASLMGSGNHTYGSEERGEGPGAFLSAASAWPLSVHPLFTGQRRQPAMRNITVDDWQTQPTAPFSLSLSGRVAPATDLKGVVLFADPQADAGDYDALTAVSHVNHQGRFSVTIPELPPGQIELRLRMCFADGATQWQSSAISVSADGVCDVSRLLDERWLQAARQAVLARRSKDLQSIIRQARIERADSPRLQRQLTHYARLLNATKPPPLDSVPRNEKRVSLADFAWDTAECGWGSPLRHQVLMHEDRTGLLHVGGEFTESGLYAHAVSRYAYRLNGAWNRFSAGYGLQDGHSGSVVFVIEADGNERFRSDVIRDHQRREIELMISGVDELVLRVEDAGDGPGSDWGVWLEPTLER